MSAYGDFRAALLVRQFGDGLTPAQVGAELLALAEGHPVACPPKLRDEAAILLAAKDWKEADKAMRCVSWV